MNTVVGIVTFDEKGRFTRLWDGVLEHLPREGEEIQIYAGAQYKVTAVVHMLASSSGPTRLRIYVERCA